MVRTFLFIISCLFAVAHCEAQFYTVTRVKAPVKVVENIEDTTETGEVIEPAEVTEEVGDTIAERKTVVTKKDLKKYAKARKRKRKGKEKETSEFAPSGLPLTIPNLISEIRKNGIQHEEIVLAQAILETGWFTSSVCKNKNNLFGLTNPRTKDYYEFAHWTDSVKAYYTKVQYRYKGGNYLQWLHDIGYAEAPDYVPAVINVIKYLRNASSTKNRVG